MSTDCIQHSHESRKAPSPKAFITLYLLFVVAIWLRYRGWMFPYLYGDDLSYYMDFLSRRCATPPEEILTGICQDRFRPVASATVIFFMHLFGGKMLGYQVADGLIQALNGMMVFLLAHRLSRGNMLASLGIALIAVASRFATYHATQVIAPVESVTLLFALVAVYSVVRADADATKAWRWAWLAIGAAFMAIHTHERFAVLSVWLVGAFVLIPAIRSLGGLRLAILIATSTAIPLFYIAYKALMFRTSFMIGTGGTNIEFELPRILVHFRHALLSLLGFNQGPDYLVGTSVSPGANLPFFLALVFACSLLYLLWKGLSARYDADSAQGHRPECLWRLAESFRWPILLATLMAFLLFPTLLTIHLEQRWIYAPFIMLLLSAAWASGRFDRARSVAVVCVMTIASLALDTAIMRHYDRFFLVYMSSFAARVKTEIIDPDPGAVGGVALLAPEANCSWALAGGQFFRVYGGKFRPVYCHDSLESVADASELPADTRVYATDGGRFVDMTAEVARIREERRNLRFDFLKSFDSGTLLNPDLIRLPNPGASILPWQPASGPAVVSLTVISGFSYRYDDIEISGDDNLLLAVGVVYPGREPARAIIRARGTDGPSEVLLDRMLSPPPEGTPPSFSAVTIPLARFGGERISIEFATETPGNDPTGHWIAFVEPRIIDIPTQPETLD